MKRAYETAPGAAWGELSKFAAYFLFPATILFLLFFLLLAITQIRAFSKGCTPLPRWGWIFTVLLGMLAAVPLKLAGTPLTNALAAGWISLGNLWMFGGLPALTGKADGRKSRTGAEAL